MYLGFDSLTLRQNEKQVVRPAFCFGKTKRGIRTRREQTQSAEKNSPMDCFCRRGQGAKVHKSAPKKSLTLRQNEKQVARPAFFFGKTKRVIRTRREQTQSAEKNSPMDCFCRRGQGAKVHKSAPKKSLTLRHEVR